MRKVWCAALFFAAATSASAQTPARPGPVTTVEGVTVTGQRPLPTPAGPRLELYEERNLAGGGVILVREASNLLHRGFADRARSARAYGRWQLCSDPNFSGACAVVEGDTPFLGTAQLSERVSSARPLPNR